MEKGCVKSQKMTLTQLFLFGLVSSPLGKNEKDKFYGKEDGQV